MTTATRREFTGRSSEIRDVPVRSVSANYQATLSDRIILVDASASPVTIILTYAALQRDFFYIKKTDSSANLVTILPQAGDSIEGAGSLSLDAANDTAVLVPNGTTAWFIVAGVGSPAAGSVAYWGNTVIVDAVYGNDATGQRARFDKPFKTIQAALAAALAGDIVYIRPGTYNENPLTIPTGVIVHGASRGGVIIQRLNVVANTTLVTMGINSRLEQVTLRLTSAGHYTLIGITFPGSTAANARVRNCRVEVNNSGAPGAGSSNVYGLEGGPAPGFTRDWDTVRDCEVYVESTGGGSKRGLMLTTNGQFQISTTNVRVKKTGGGAGTYIGIESSGANASVFVNACIIQGDTADISQTGGSITLSATSLVNGTANGKSFSVEGPDGGPPWSIEGAVPAGATNYIRPGSAPASAVEIFERIGKKRVLRGLQLRARVAPGGGKTTTVTARKNGVDTIVVATLSGPGGTSNSSGNVSADYAVGDDFSLKVVTDAGNATADLVVTPEWY